MKLGVIGKSGQLARALKRLTDRCEVETVYFDRQALDLTSTEKDIEQFVRDLNVDAIIIAAAYTAVDRAEAEFELAFQVNAKAPEVIAKVCAQKGVALIYVSTDYVFEGTSRFGPYRHDSETAPINVYGSSKLAGEHSVLTANAKTVIVRTSWVFDGAGSNFMTTMLRLGALRDRLNVVADQIGRPTYAGDLAEAILGLLPAVISGKTRGVYHVSGTGEPVSWANFSRAIFALSSMRVDVSDILAADFPTLAQRPAYSVLDTQRYEKEFKALPHWKKGLEHAYLEWKAINERPKG